MGTCHLIILIEVVLQCMTVHHIFCQSVCHTRCVTRELINPEGKPLLFITLFDHFHKNSLCLVQRDVFISPIKALSIHLTLIYTALPTKKNPIISSLERCLFFYCVMKNKYLIPQVKAKKGEVVVRSSDVNKRIL